MAFVWVQQWVALPVIVEEQMGDGQTGTGFPQSGQPRSGVPQEDVYLSIRPGMGSTQDHSPSEGAQGPFHSQYSSIPQQFTDSSRISSTRSPYNATTTIDSSASNFNMSALGGALSDYPAGSAAQNLPQSLSAQRGISGASTSALVYQLQQNLQYGNSPGGSFPSQQGSNSAFGQTQYPSLYIPNQGGQQSGYGGFAQPQQRSAGPSPHQQSFPSYPQHAQQYMYYPQPYGTHGHPSQAFAGQIPPGSFNRRSSLPTASGQGYDPSSQIGSLPGLGRAVGDTNSLGGYGSSVGFPGMRTEPPSSMSNVPRGPPRKPKQSGHALWVGNLPPGTTVLDLKDHFSRDATRDIESLFLISKSNCAFVNYRTEESCAAAMHRFHDSRFHGVRLVCRLRRSSTATSGAPAAPSAMSVLQAPSPQRHMAQPDGVDGILSQAEESSDEVALVDSSEHARVPEKFFVVKSLTLQDLELSVRNGVWATQAHNEETFNNAYKSADNVYLIFSANKSGEYFGYARMASPITSTAATETSVAPAPRAESFEPSDSPKTIPTPATEFAPRGHIIDDSARGTIFWEADLTDEEDDIVKEEIEPESIAADVEESGSPTAWGKSFKVEWISTNRLPFYRTRGLRNPWNANREVKIARDGTELETSVGKRLVQMFHRLGPSNVTQAGPPFVPMQSLPPMGGPASQTRSY